MKKIIISLLIIGTLTTGSVFAYNKNAINFYEKAGYHPRMLIDIKKLY